MKYVFVIVFAVMASCRHDSSQTAVPSEISALSAGQTLFMQVKDQLDYSTREKVIGRENVIIWMIRFKGDTNRIYATSVKGELLYERRMKDDKNGTIDLSKNGETVRISFVDGVRTISSVSPKSGMKLMDYHGGTGFCQREKGEKFGDCFNAECSEFCDSFVSCIALATQPSVPILIGIACSCDAQS